MDINRDSVVTDGNDSNTNILPDEIISASSNENLNTEPSDATLHIKVHQENVLPPGHEISQSLIKDWDEVSEDDRAPQEVNTSTAVFGVEESKVSNDMSPSAAVSNNQETTNHIDLSLNSDVSAIQENTNNNALEISSSAAVTSESQEITNNIDLSLNSAVSEIREITKNIDLLSNSTVTNIPVIKNDIEISSNTTVAHEIKKDNIEISPNSCMPDVQETKNNIVMLSNSASAVPDDKTKEDNILPSYSVTANLQTCNKVDRSSSNEIVQTKSNGHEVHNKNQMIVPKQECSEVVMRKNTSGKDSESPTQISNVNETDEKMPLRLINDVFMSEDIKTTEDIVIVSVSNMPSYETEMRQNVISKLENINVINLTDDSSQSEWDKALGILEDTKIPSGLRQDTDLPNKAPRADNNNSSSKQETEILDRKQLLDILEGNEDTSPTKPVILITPKTESPVGAWKKTDRIKVEMDAIVEHKIALNQLTGLPRKRKSFVSSLRKNITVDSPKLATPTEKIKIVPQPIRTYSKEDTNNIVQTLVDDWEDVELPTESTTETDVLKNANDEVAKSAECAPVGSMESDQTLPPRRMSRIIKKKVIFDPDNPDSFSSTSTVGLKPSTQVQASNEIIKDVRKEKTNTPLKKKPVLPVPKGIKRKLKTVTQWAKPQMKTNFKTKKKISKDLKKRKTEVDRLLMDEGAVNMIYQLELSNNNADVPVSKHNRKNIKSRAAIIKKAVINQSNSQNSSTKIKLFRIRNVEKRGDSQNKQKAKVKAKSTIRESMKSPSPCEEFTTDANASIIVRRHSSSSYTSSTCLSPRRLSDVETLGSEQTSNRAGQNNKAKNTKGFTSCQKDVFSSILKDGLDRKDCLSLKEKLNSKLSNVLNFKRKSESNSLVSGKNQKIFKKTETQVRKEVHIDGSESTLSNSQISAKHQKFFKKNETQVRKDTPTSITESAFTQLSIKCVNNIMHIIVKKSATGDENLYNLQTLQELQFALHKANESPHTNITLLSSEDGTLCGGLDLNPVLSSRQEKRLKAATEMADSVRSLLLAMESHKNLLCASVSGRCVGLGLGMLVLCDLTVVARDSTFCLYQAPAQEALPAPGMSVLMTHNRALHSTTCSELLLFGTTLSSDRARQVKLVTRVLPQDTFKVDLQALLAPLAAQSPASLTLKKQLLRLGPVNSMLRACVDRERDVLLQYWLSAAGQVAIRELGPPSSPSTSTLRFT